MKNIHKGFTLFEIAIVLAISLVVTSLGVITLSRLQGLFRLRSAADEIKSRLQYGRELAIAGKNRAAYSINLSGGAIRLLSDGNEISRYVLPDGVTISPSSFIWSYTAVTGAIPSCSPCQITLTSVGLAELVNIQANGIVD